jgi:hypothetical protein
MTKNLECNLSHIDNSLRKCSSEVKDLLRKLLNKNPDKRPSPL